MDEKLQKQYDRLINARNFHYENLNRWLSFFYVAIGAIFAGFCTLHSSEGEVSAKLEIMVIGVLYLVSLCAYLSGKGYYYWENQWIMLVRDFENNHLSKEKPNQRVYSVFANMVELNEPINPIGGANVSTTKVALFMTFLMSVLWGAMLIYLVVKILGFDPCCKCYVMGCSLLGSVIITYVLSILGVLLLRSNLENTDDLKL